MIDVYGVNLNAKGKNTILVKRELNRVKLRKIKTYDYNNPSLYLVVFGKQAFNDLMDKLEFDDARGNICWFKNSLVFPTFHPEVVIRKPRLKALFRHDLENFSSMIRLDAYGHDANV